MVHEVLHHEQRVGFFLSWEAEQAREEAASQLEMNNMWEVRGVEVLGWQSWSREGREHY